MSREQLSQDSLSEATRSRASFSGHGNAKGAAGYRVPSTDPDCEFLSQAGQMSVINPREGGFPKIRIGAAWDNIQVQQAGFFSRLLKKMSKQGVDVDLGCLYELHDGRRGAIQSFGDLYGAYNDAPFVHHTGDERTGDKDGLDEIIEINGARWGEVKRILAYVYIYHGAPDWDAIRPQVQLLIPGETPMIVTPRVGRNDLSVCAVAMFENRENGIRITNHTEYFPGHAEMDRAFGFGLEWEGGSK